MANFTVTQAKFPRKISSPEGKEGSVRSEEREREEGRLGWRRMFPSHLSKNESANKFSATWRIARLVLVLTFWQPVKILPRTDTFGN